MLNVRTLSITVIVAPSARTAPGIELGGKHLTGFGVNQMAGLHELRTRATFQKDGRLASRNRNRGDDCVVERLPWQLNRKDHVTAVGKQVRPAM